MRKTRLVILPGVRSTTQFGCLLLLLACPTIAFKGQEKRDIEPLCKLNELRIWWLPFDTGEERNVTIKHGELQNRQFGENDKIISWDELLTVMYSRRKDSITERIMQNNKNKLDTQDVKYFQRNKRHQKDTPNRMQQFTSGIRTVTSLERIQDESERVLSKGRRSVTSSERRNIVPERRETDMTNYRRNVQNERDTSIRRQKLISATRTIELTEQGKENRLSETRRIIISSRGIVPDRRSNEFYRSKRNTGDRRETLNGRQQINSGIRNDISLERIEGDKERKFSESTQLRTSLNRKNIVLERRLFEISNILKLNIRDQRDPHRRAYPFTSGIQRVISSEQDGYDKVRGMAESRGPVKSLNRKGIVLERRFTEGYRSKRHIRNQKDTENVRLQSVSGIRTVTYPKPHEYDKERSLSLSRRLLTHFNRIDIALESRASEVYKLKRNIQNKRRTINSQQKLVAAIRTVISLEFIANSREQRYSKSRQSITTFNRENIVLQRRVSDVNAANHNTRNHRRQQLESWVPSGASSIYDKEPGLSDSRQSLTSSVLKDVSQQRKAYDFNIHAGNVRYQRDTPNRRQQFIFPIRTATFPEYVKGDLFESKRSIAPSNRKGLVLNTEVNRSKRKIPDEMHTPDKEPSVSGVRDMISAQNVQQKYFIKLLKFFSDRYSDNSWRHIIANQLSTTDRNTYLLKEVRGFPKYEMTVRVGRSVKDKVWANWDMANTCFGQQSLQGFLLSTLLAGYVITSTLHPKQHAFPNLISIF